MHFQMWALKTKTYVLACAILVGCLYLTAFTGITILFLAYWITAYVLFVVITFIYIGSLLLNFLPAPLRELHGRRQLRYFVFLLVPVLVFVLATMFSRSVAPDQQGITRLFGLTGILTFSVFVLWSLIRGTKPMILVIVTILFSIYLIFVTEWASTMKKAPQEPSLEELAALPYVAWVSSEDSNTKTGVTLHNAAKASPGINLYAPNHLAEAYLTDMNGKVLHKWVNRKSWEIWAHVALNENGDLLAIYKDKQLTRLAWDSSVIWRLRGRFHHDARFAKNGDVYALSRNDEIVIHHFLPVPILNDYVVVLSPTGQIKKKYSLFDSLKGYVGPGKISNIYKHLLKPKRTLRLATAIISRNPILFSQRTPFDLFHTNTVELVESPNALFNEGDLLISARNLSLVAVLNPEKRKINWETNQFTMQHQPSFLANGNILVFDNGLPSTGSRVAEINPRSQEIVWEYKGKPAQDFYAYNRGGTQRLPNGNTLITESPDGRAFEVTGEREIVWEFFTPQIYPGKRGVIYRLMRFSRSDGYSCLRTFFDSSAQ